MCLGSEFYTIPNLANSVVQTVFYGLDQIPEYRLRPIIHILWQIDGQVFVVLIIQSNLNNLNTDGLFTMANSNLFLSPNEILPIAQENRYLRKFSFFIIKLYVVCTHWNCLIEAPLISTQHTIIM